MERLPAKILSIKRPVSGIIDYPPRAAAAAVLALAALRAGETIPLAQLAPRYIRLSEAEILCARRSAEATIEG